MNTIFIADLHIHEQHPEILEAFSHFAQSILKTTEALYILGDLFEAWPGDDDHNELAEKTMQILKMLTSSGVKVYLMRGNHDFLIGIQFLKKTGCQLIPDPFIANIYHQRVLLMHGDLLLSNHFKYKLYRAFVQNPFIRWCILKILPLSKRKKIAKQLNESSNHHNPITSISLSEVTKLMKKLRVHYFIHGHLHKPTLDQIKSSNSKQKMIRVVLGAWRQFDRNILICKPSSEGLSFTFQNTNVYQHAQN